jgi:hypothetical protein
MDSNGERHMSTSDSTGHRFSDEVASEIRFGCAAALMLCSLTNMIVFLGLDLGESLIRTSPVRGHTFGYTEAAYANWDGQWYAEIAAKGYSFNPDAHSNVAFFPAYPMLGRVVARVTGLRYDDALLAVSNLLLAMTFVLLAKYLQAREGGDPNYTGFVLLALGMVPTSFFFRVAYSESLFLFLMTLTFHGMQRRWSLFALAAIIGLATATRAVGVALIPALAWHAWQRSPKWPTFTARMLVLGPLACWGLFAYMAYLQVEFGDPLVFAKTQAHWRIRPPTGIGTRLFDLATLEPIRSLFDPSGPAYAQTIGRADDLLFCLRAADPVYFLGAVVLVILGSIKRWLTDVEIIAAVGLLIIPYATVGYEQYMQSMGRYSTVVLPAYLVLGRLLCRIPGSVVAAMIGISGFFLGVYSALFAAWYVFI